MEKTKEAAIKFVENGGKCFYQYGYGFKGAKATEKSKEWAMEKLQHKGWSFGMGFYELSWEQVNGETVLLFNEFSENDLY